MVHRLRCMVHRLVLHRLVVHRLVLHRLVADRLVMGRLVVPRPVADRLVVHRPVVGEHRPECVRQFGGSQTCVVGWLGWCESGCEAAFAVTVTCASLPLLTCMQGPRLPSGG
jgi:hypothetical protein